MPYCTFTWCLPKAVILTPRFSTYTSNRHVALNEKVNFSFVLFLFMI